MRGYIICTTPRSGSNYFCQLLASTDALGNPLEYFNPLGRRALEAPDYPDDPQEQVRWILMKGATSNGVYGLKMFPNQLERTLQKLDVLALLPDLSFVYLLRRDTLGQAISWARALQSNQYRSTQAALRPSSYDAGLVAERLTEIVCFNATWDIYFARTGIQPLVLIYEDIERDHRSAVQQVASLVGVTSVKADPRKVSVAKQRDALTEEWRQRFVCDRGERNAIDLVNPQRVLQCPN